MALVFPGSTCALCGAEIGSGRPYFATSGTFLPREHRLFPCCDAPLHWHCYEEWADRPEFAREYFKVSLERNDRNPYWGLSLETDRMFVEVNPDPQVDRVMIHLAETGTSVWAPFSGWEEWITDEPAALEGLQPLEQQALHEVWSTLRRELPDRQALLDPVDWEAKRAQLERERQEEAQLQQHRLTEASCRNERCRAMAAAGAVCPHCERREAARFVEKAAPETSYFICRGCGRSFGPAS